MKNLEIKEKNLEKLGNLAFVSGSPKEISEQLDDMPKEAKAQALIMLQTFINKVNEEYYLVKKDNVNN